MHALLEAATDRKPALEPRAAIGPALRAIAGDILGKARTSIVDPQLSDPDAVHEFRRAMKQWRALMRLLEPFVTGAERWRREARDHARSMARARDGQSALNAFDDIMKKAVAFSARSVATIRGRLETMRGSEEQAVLTDELRGAILAWLDAAAADAEQWPLDPFDFTDIAAQLAEGYRQVRKRIPDDWSLASAEDLHHLRQRVVDHRYQMEMIEPLWPRQGRMWTEEAERLRDRLGRCQDLEILKGLTEPHQLLAHWRSRLTTACVERRGELSQRAARIALRLFAEKPKAFRKRLETLWEHGR